MQTSEIAKQVKQLRTTFNLFGTRDLSWRKSQLEQLKRMLLTHQQDFLAALKADLNKAEHEAWSTEIGFVVGDIEHTIKHLKSWSKARTVKTPVFLQPGKSYLLPEPLGCVLIIGAWNYPLQLVLAPLVAALAAGNCAIIKPSELAPNTANLLATIVPRYMAHNACQVVTGGVAETTELLQQKFDHIFYTGGERVGKIVMRAAADHLTPVTLELGGKCPCIVDNTANLPVSAARIVWSKWMNAGQTCVAPDYVIVEKSLLQPLIQALKQKITEYYGSDASQSADYGRIVNADHFARLHSYLQNQDIIVGGNVDAEKKYIEPTIVLNPRTDSSVMLEEIFGPILIIQTVDHIQESIALINSKPKPLALYVYTKDRQFEQLVLSQTSAGSVTINDGMVFMANPNLPFGGVGNSGMGVYHGKFGFDTFSHLKTVIKRRFWLDVALRYPPFSALKLRLLKKLL